MGGSFTKQIAEQYLISVEFLPAMPDGSSLTGGTLSATDLSTGADATALVLDTATAQIEGTEALAFVKGGIDQHAYRLRFVVNIAPGFPIPVLVDDIIMVIWDT